MRCALVDAKKNLIVNVVVADPKVDKPPDGLMLVMVPDFVNPGDAWNKGVFVQAVTPTVPSATPNPRIAAFLAGSTEA